MCQKKSRIEKNSNQIFNSIIHILEMTDSTGGTTNIFFLRKVNMPRRSEAQRLLDDSQDFLNRSSGGPIRTNRSAEARAERRHRREAQGLFNYEAYKERRERNSQSRRNSRQLRRFTGGQAEEANLQLTTPAMIQAFLDQVLPRLEQGERFILNNGDRYFTLTNEKYADIQEWVTNMELFGNDFFDVEGYEEKSDEEAKDGNFYSNMTISSAPIGNGYAFAQGAYFPYTHDFDCEELTNETLAS